mmetsp:Transcript_12543/g.31853  ORF Transcript_12543/g.31853 Transcript_12543/m.31853 type:complete len:303 (+) Transcript_12543:860-1768(+)
MFFCRAEEQPRRSASSHFAAFEVRERWRRRESASLSCWAVVRRSGLGEQKCVALPTRAGAVCAPCGCWASSWLRNTVLRSSSGSGWRTRLLPRGDMAGAMSECASLLSAAEEREAVSARCRRSCSEVLVVPSAALRTGSPAEVEKQRSGRGDRACASSSARHGGRVGTGEAPTERGEEPRGLTTGEGVLLLLRWMRSSSERGNRPEMRLAYRTAGYSLLSTGALDLWSATLNTELACVMRLRTVSEASSKSSLGDAKSRPTKRRPTSAGAMERATICAVGTRCSTGRPACSSSSKQRASSVQ